MRPSQPRRVARLLQPFDNGPGGGVDATVVGDREDVESAGQVRVLAAGRGAGAVRPLEEVEAPALARLDLNHVRLRVSITTPTGTETRPPDEATAVHRQCLGDTPTHPRSWRSLPQSPQHPTFCLSSLLVPLCH